MTSVSSASRLQLLVNQPLLQQGRVRNFFHTELAWLQIWNRLNKTCKEHTLHGEQSLINVPVRFPLPGHFVVHCHNITSITR